MPVTPPDGLMVSTTFEKSIPMARVWIQDGLDSTRTRLAIDLPPENWTGENVSLPGSCRWLNGPVRSSTRLTGAGHAISVAAGAVS